MRIRVVICAVDGFNTSVSIDVVSQIGVAVCARDLFIGTGKPFVIGIKDVFVPGENGLGLLGDVSFVVIFVDGRFFFGHLGTEVDDLFDFACGFLKFVRGGCIAFCIGFGHFNVFTDGCRDMDLHLVGDDDLYFAVFIRHGLLDVVGPGCTAVISDKIV